MEPEEKHLVELTADIVAAQVANNKVPATELPGLIAAVHAALAQAAGGPSPAPAEPEQPAAAVSIRKSTARRDVILSMIDGKPYKSLKRHIQRHGYTPQSYRKAFGLPDSYPMVAPEYAELRSRLAKDVGLGLTKNRRRNGVSNASAASR